MSPSPSNILEFLRGQLASKLDSLPNDRARIAVLAQQYGVWTSFSDKFRAFGTQPFGGPHPIYGEMDAFDFANVLAMINSERARIEVEAVSA
jgi:hypothetical protein